MNQQGHKKTGQRDTYNTNRGLLAAAAGDATALRGYVDQLSEREDGLTQGYRQYLRGLWEGLNGDSHRSLDLLMDAVKQFNQVSSKRSEAIAALGISHLLEAPGEALRWAIHAHRQFVETNDDVGASKALLNMGACYTTMSSHDRAIESLRSALEFQQRTENPIDAGIACLNLSSTYFRCGDLANAVVYGNDSIQWLEKSRGVANGYVWQTNGWARITEQTEGLLAMAYVNNGTAIKSLGERDVAVDLYMQAHKIMRDVNDLKGEAIVLNQIGEVYRECGEYSVAEEYFQQGKNLFEQAGIRGYMYAVALQGIGQSAAAQSKFAEASVCYQNSYREFESVGDKAGEAEILLLEGDLMIARGTYSLAIPSLQRALILARSISATQYVVRASRSLGSAYMHIDSAMAREHLGRALMLAEEHSMKLEQQNIHRELTSYYKLIGDSTQALSHFEKFHALQQEIFTENADRRLRNLEILHRVEQYKQSLAAMQKKVRQIESDLEEKTRELAMLAERIMEKQEFVRLVERGVNRLIAAQPERKDGLARELLQSIQSAGDTRGDWGEFSKKFLTIHRQFAERLMELAPGLRPAELQVCVLIRLSMQAKQIADVLGIVPKTVFNHQKSIRERLGLERGENLKSYLMRLDSAADAT